MAPRRQLAEIIAGLDAIADMVIDCYIEEQRKWRRQAQEGKSRLLQRACFRTAPLCPATQLVRQLTVGLHHFEIEGFFKFV